MFKSSILLIRLIRSYNITYILTAIVTIVCTDWLMSCYIQDCIDLQSINILNYIGFIQELYYRIIGIYRNIIYIYIYDIYIYIYIYVLYYIYIYYHTYFLMNHFSAHQRKHFVDFVPPLRGPPGRAGGKGRAFQMGFQIALKNMGTVKFLAILAAGWRTGKATVCMEFGFLMAKSGFPLWWLDVAKWWSTM